MADDEAATTLWSFDGSSDEMASNNPIKSPSRDSFSELTLLMRAKKPYTLSSKSTRLPPIASGHSISSNCTIASENPLSLPPKSANAPETVAEFLQQQELSASSVSQVELARKFRSEKRIPSWDIYSATTTHNSEGFPIQLENPLAQNNEKELGSMKENIMILERTVMALKRSKEALREANGNTESILDKLKYENVIKKDQISAMSRSLAEKEMTVKNQQLDIDELKRKLANSETQLKELSNVAVERDYLQQTIEKLTRELDEAVQAKSSAQHHETQSKDLADTTTKQNKVIADLREKLVEAKLKNIELEDDIQDLKRLSNETELTDLNAKLRQKMVECDRQRNQLKTVEAQLQHCQDRLKDITNNGMSLQGAVHLVKPSAQAQLPKGVMSCSECYANNLACDSKATCHNCAEHNKSCARWRCSLKHKLGSCPLAPCKFPHDAQGWLVRYTDRPEW
ncbi:purine-cytosine permease-like protein [Curvularia clavata]|uniref:Purine-cytosine permease-like protein n=1 Tax=Curvularia clavata TaxID=95742 RepID=A0A9Q8Z4V0_CURCL|nr:purine-cytosine permease-like protein [Curvularia clavata]